MDWMIGNSWCNPGNIELDRPMRTFVCQLTTMERWTWLSIHLFQPPVGDVRKRKWFGVVVKQLEEEKEWKGRLVINKWTDQHRHRKQQRLANRIKHITLKNHREEARQLQDEATIVKNGHLKILSTWDEEKKIVKEVVSLGNQRINELAVDHIAISLIHSYCLIDIVCFSCNQIIIYRGSSVENQFSN